MNRTLFVLIPLISAVWLAACQPAVSEPTTEATPSATLSPTWTPTATATTIPTFTPTPPASPTPTFTPTPTPITLPATNGTPIPDLPYEVITVDNVHRLRQIARYGYPRLLDKQPYRLTADGKTIVVGTTLGLEFYDAQTQLQTARLEVEFLYDFDISADGRYLLTLSGENTLTVWTRDGQTVQTFEGMEIGDSQPLKPAALSPDGTLLAVQRKKMDWQESDKVDVYRAADGSLVDTLRGRGVVFSPDGQYLASVFDGSVRLYPLAELGEGWEKRLPQQTLPWCRATEGKCGLVFSADGTLAAVVRAAQVDVYQVAERRLIRQVSGWEVQETYYLPQVQITEGRMLIMTLPVYDSQRNIKIHPQAIAVDIAGGEWLSKSEVKSGFAYLDAGQAKVFEWQPEGKMPEFYRPFVEADSMMLVVKEVLNENLIICSNNECVQSPVKDKLYDQDGNSYTLLCNDKTRCEVFDDNSKQLISSFSLPKDAYVWLGVISTEYGKVVIIETFQGYNSYSVAYRSDGKKATVARNFLGKILFDGRKIAFAVFDEGIKILDVEQWVIRQYSTDSDLLYFSEDKIYIANQSWDGNGPAIQVLDISTRKSSFISVPKWRFAITWYLSGFEVAESAEKFSSLFLVSTGGVMYAVDLVKMEFIGSLTQNTPYSNAMMKFSKDGRLLMTYGTDGFIRVWAVVPEGVDVR